MKKFLNKLLDIWAHYWLIIIIIIVLISLYIYEKNTLPEKYNTPVPYSKLSDSEKLEILEEENQKLQEDLNDVNSKLDKLTSEYNEATDLINLLRDQLEENGIEPYEL